MTYLEFLQVLGFIFLCGLGLLGLIGMGFLIDSLLSWFHKPKSLPNIWTSDKAKKMLFDMSVLEEGTRFVIRRKKGQVTSVKTKKVKHRRNRKS